MNDRCHQFTQARVWHTDTRGLQYAWIIIEGVLDSDGVDVLSSTNDYIFDCE